MRKSLLQTDPQNLYVLLATVLAPLMSLALVIFNEFVAYSGGLITDRQMYGIAVPTMMASAICLAIGLLAMTLRTPRTIIACCAGMVLPAVAYFAAGLLVNGQFSHDPLSLCYLLLPLLALVMRPRAHERAKLSAGPLEIPQKISKTGNIAYTSFGLMILFTWVLWFDFCYTIMESVLGTILSFRLLQQLQAPNTAWKAVGTISQVLSMVMVPIISIRSDRYRGRRGRRIPFLMYASPVVCALLALLGFGNDIGAWLHASVIPHVASFLPAWLGSGALASASQDTIIIWTFFVLNLAFFVANLFMGTIFYYLFNDVVPPGHFMKFMSYMRVVGALAGMCYSYFIYQYSNKFGPLDVNLGFWSYHTDNIWYPKLILVGAAVFYMACGMITFFKMYEPAYPPPPPYPKGNGFFQRTGGILKTIGKECFSHRFYVIIFLYMLLDGLTNPFNDIKQPMYASLGLDLSAVGTIQTWGSGITLVLTILTASYGDRFRPLPLMVVGAAFVVMTAPIGMLYLIPGLPSSWYMGIMIAYLLSHIPVGIVVGIASGPLLMELFPRDRFGQFSAAGSTLRNVVCNVLLAIPIGMLLDWLKYRQGEYYFRYAFTWQVIFQVLALVCLYAIYRHWKRLGGKKGFKPPQVG